MSCGSNNALASLFANASIRSPMPSTSSAAPAAAAASPAATRPTLAHSKSIGAEPSTPRSRPSAGKRQSRRSIAASLSTSTTPVPLYHQRKQGGSVSPPQHHHHHQMQPLLQPLQHGSGSYSPFAGARFSDSPSARAIPLPPAVWFEDDEDSQCAPSSDTESLSSFTTNSSSDSALPASLSDESGNLVGIRVNPLQLIAAVSAL
ncbi:hypothetical protein PFISCL1PPCAC_18301 [Pristionchus fissidentatus]|uniref:Uncharacterized protein n=1 Tax=Pristionchus fissidentatus TaxID=1538716 RepID=A0AAV5W4Y8_9BILA|nr:hypothetical protein PFISCL1PPCAC_18301 [Pristionchus fissidentatus]